MINNDLNQEIEEYLQRHNIQQLLQSVIMQLCIDRPKEPIEFIINYLQNKFNLKGFDIFKESMNLLQINNGNNNIDNEPNNMNIISNNNINNNNNNNNKDKEKFKDIGLFSKSRKSSFSESRIASSISSHNHQFDKDINQMAPKRRGGISDAPPSGSNDKIQLKSEEVYMQLENTLKDNKIFAHLDVEERRELCNRMVMKKYSKNEEVIRQGKKKTCFLYQKIQNYKTKELNTFPT